MGTNYYVTFPDREPIHLGKRNAGCAFIFRAQPWFTSDNATDEWGKLLPTGIIRDEYGHILNPETMWLIAKDEADAQLPWGDFYTSDGFAFVYGDFS